MTDLVEVEYVHPSFELLKSIRKRQRGDSRGPFSIKPRRDEMKSWVSTDLSQLIAQIESGKRPVGGASEESGEIPSLGGENILRGGGINSDVVKRISAVFFKNMRQGRLRNDDVLVNKDGAQTGKVGLYTGLFEKAAINEHVFLLRGHPSKVTQNYLYYFLLSTP